MNVDADLKIRYRGFVPLLGVARKLGVMSEAAYQLHANAKPPPNFLYWNFGKRGLPFADGSVEVLFTSHVLEHFPRWKGQFLVKEAYRVLKPGGLIRVIVPDLEVLTRRYLLGHGVPSQVLPPAQDRPLSAREFNLVFYTKSHVEPAKEALDMRLAGLFPHMYIYDFTDMRELLTAAGFESVQQLAFRTGRCPDIQKLDNNEDISMYVEAQKPAGSRPQVVKDGRA